MLFKVRWLSTILCVTGAFLLIAIGPVGAQQTLASAPALKPAVEELKSELALTDQQVQEAENILVGFVARAKTAVNNFGGITFESIVDLLSEAQAIREEFIPRITSLLDESQVQKLKTLPKAHELYVSAMAGWLTEAQLEKLKERVGLTEGQIPETRALLLGQFEDAVGIVEGFVNRDGAKLAKSEVMQAVLDLRSVQRQTRRKLRSTLTEEQKTRLDAFEKETDEESENAS
jgi:hypothetical protein